MYVYVIHITPNSNIIFLSQNSNTSPSCVMDKKASLKMDLSFDRDDNDDEDDDDNFPDFYDRDEDHAHENTVHSASAFTTASAARKTINSEEMMADKNNTVALPLFRHGHDGSSSKKKKSTEASSTEKRHGGEESTEDENGVGNARGHLNGCEKMSFAKSKNDTAAARSNHRDENKNKYDPNHIYETSTPSSKSLTNQRTKTKTRTRTTQTNTKPKSANSANASKSSKHAGATPAAVEIDLSHHSSRHPVFSTYMNDGILLLIASYLEFRDVMSLARVNKYNFHEGLGVDCLFCRDPRHGDDDNDNDDDDGKFQAFHGQRFHSKDGGNDDNSRAHDGDYDDAGVLDRTKEEETLLLPCLYPYKEKLLPVILPSSSPSSSLSQEGETKTASMPSRPSGLARTFARETVIFSNACVEFASAGSGGSIPGPGSDGHLAIGNRNNNDNNNSYNDATTSSAPPTSSSSSTMAPKKIINLTTTERILLTSFKHVTWTHAYSLKSGIRLSYVTNDNHNSALVTVWSKTSNENEARSSSIPSSPLSTSCSSSHHSKERYVPPNVHSILEAAFHSESGLCAILATSLGGGGHDKYSALVSSSSSFVPSTPKRSSSPHSSSYPSTTAFTNSSGYILSLIELPRQPFSRNNAGSATVHPPSHSSSSNHFNPSFSSTAAKLSSPQTPHSSTRPHQHTLRWQKYLSNHQWKLFSSSSTRAIVSFSPLGTHVLFGSTETWGLVDVETGSRVWTLFRSHPSISRWNGGDGGADTMGTMPGSSTGHAADIPSPRSYPTAASFPSPSYPERASSTSSRLASPIDAHLIHRGFLFVLQDNGKVLRIYDELDLSCPGEPLAEGDLPWSPSNSNYDSNNHHRYHRGRGNNNNNNTDRDQADFQLEFCSGRIWITGTHKKDLLCSTPPRLLRRLRSRNNDTPLHLKFLRVMNDLSVSTPHTMLSWNDTHLYILDSNKIYRWNAYRSNVNSRRKGIITVYSGGNKRVQNFHVDGTKLLICTVNPYWDTSKRIWEGNERMWVVPIDSFGSIVGDGGWTEHLAKLRKDGNVPFVQRMRDQCQLLEQPVESFDQMEVFLKKVLPSCQSSFSSSSSFAGANDTITDLFLRNVNGFGGVSNYHVLNMECDGRFVTLHCERSGGDDVDATVKLAVLDLYKT